MYEIFYNQILVMCKVQNRIVITKIYHQAG